MAFSPSRRMGSDPRKESPSPSLKNLRRHSALYPQRREEKATQREKNRHYQ
eukprot:CAMPEP_0169280952 /NCGR_PEP_ID=MMETSP1016-20121227/55939_1 /TAXON_ID=342587 /ORGANISM="Karlodinium micrum, Strain CCMP2283" /LENGTH=50 /DNA_ID=CAMNT_0009369427 /DNA_START=393 /DNA_END=545 /DNA_ORIENTATION=-